MHLRFRKRNIYTGEELKSAMVDARNIPMEPSGSVFRNWRGTFEKFYSNVPGICSTDIIEMRFCREDTGLVAIKWAMRQEIADTLVFIEQPQLLKEARKANCDIARLLHEVKNATAMDEMLTNYPMASSGLITASRKKYLLEKLEDELSRLAVDDSVLNWWRDLPCITDTRDTDTEGTETPLPALISPPQSPICPHVVDLTVTSTAPSPACSLSSSSFAFMTDIATRSRPAAAEVETEFAGGQSEGSTPSKTADGTVRQSLHRTFHNLEMLAGTKRKRTPSARARTEQ